MTQTTLPPWLEGGPGDGRPSSPSPARRPRMHPVAQAGVLVLVGALVGLAAGLLFVRSGSQVKTVPAASPVINPSVAAAVNGAVVDINTTLGFENGAAAGTGIVLTPTGRILTNNHVVEGATSITATDVRTGKTYAGTVVGYDESNDVAVVQLNSASGLKTAAIGDSSTVKVGDPVMAVGNAGGVGGTPRASAGVVTGLNQPVDAADEGGVAEQLTGLIQTSAQLIAGDSGGPLVDSAGRIVGMDTAGSARFNFRNPSASGFAIPINKAISIARQIAAGNGSSTIHIGPTAFLGIEVAPSTSAPAQPGGALVAGAVPGSPAAAAGIGGGDLITAVGASEINSSSGVTSALVRYHPGDTVSVTWLDQTGARHTASLRLASGPTG